MLRKVTAETGFTRVRLVTLPLTDYSAARILTSGQWARTGTPGPHRGDASDDQAVHPTGTYFDARA
jgi:hypothetical protein